MIRVAFVIDNSNWIGGLNYYRNLISSIENIADPKIEVIVFIEPNSSLELTEGYGDIEIIRSKIISTRTIVGLVRRLVRKFFFGQDYVLEFLLKRNNIDVISHFSGQLSKNKKIKTIGWIPDFQHKHLPQFFDESDWKARENSFSNIIKNSDLVILSSKNAELDLIAYSPEYAKKTRVLNFVPDINISKDSILSKDELELKYDFKGDFIFLPNQFWAHKNHITVIQALSLLKKDDINVTIVASGNTHDYRAPGHFEKLSNLIDELHVKDNFKIIGIIPYIDLLSLMVHSNAVLNPSLFEGWSSTVEEAKALDKQVLLSDIPVHREQNPHRAMFFQAENPIDLKNQILDVISNSTGEKLGIDENNHQKHMNRRIKFAKNYQEIIMCLFSKEP